MNVFVSTFMSPHMKPLCDNLYQYTSGNFCYVETIELTQERKTLGYEYDNIPYLKKLTGKLEEQIDIVCRADWAIINVLSTDFSVIKARLETGKLTFFISERVLKRGALKLLDYRFWRLVDICHKSRRKKVYLLCMGGFVAKDYALMGFHKEHSFKFGYFPETTITDTNNSDLTSHKLNILWVGRMINWKRPIFAVKVLEELNNRGIYARLLMIGDGSQLIRVKKQIEKDHMENVELLGIQSNEVVQNYMAKADVLLITSTKREGWGAVVNEALSLGTPVVSSCTVGAAPYMLEDGKNGYKFTSNSVYRAADAIEQLIASDKQQMRECSMDTIRLWNAKVAATRLLQCIDAIDHDTTPFIYKEGPMSRG